MFLPIAFEYNTRTRINVMLFYKSYTNYLHVPFTDYLDSLCMEMHFLSTPDNQGFIVYFISITTF
jgi:hypothetical protein